VLALMVASYQAKFGLEESLRLLSVETLSDEDARMMASGLEIMVEILGTFREDAPDERGSVH
jgi:hypothetical protein